MKLPTLSKHYDLTITQALQKIYDYFLLSDYSQTNIYRGNITSLKYILINKPNDDLLEEIKNQLTTMCIRYFESPLFKQTLNELYVEPEFIKEDNNLLYLDITITAIVDEKTYRINNSTNLHKDGDILNSKYIEELHLDFENSIFTMK